MIFVVYSILFVEKGRETVRVDKFTLASVNKRLVLETVRDLGPINKAEVARITALSIPTVVKIMTEMEGNKIIRPCGWQGSNGGKRAQLYEFAGDAFFSIGVDIGRTNVKAVAMNLSGRILNTVSIPTADTLPEQQMITRVSTLIMQCASDKGLSAKTLLGIGIGMPGILDTQKGMVLFSPNFQWENIDLITPLRKQLKIQDLYIQLENSNRALALGEYYFGAGKDSGYMVCINLGYGIGSAIISGGDFYTGSSGTSGEFGHITVEKDGPLCTCGNNGCLEAVASGRAIAQQAHNLIDSGVVTNVTQFTDGGSGIVEAKTVFAAAENGDEASRDLVRKAGEYIGIGLASYINILDPERIVLAGGMANAHVLKQQIRQTVKVRQMRFAGRRVTIKTTLLGADATAVGAAALILKRLIEAGGDTNLKNE